MTVGETFVVSVEINHNSGDNVNIQGFNKNCPVRVQVIDAWARMLATGATSADIFIRQGAGEANETFDDIGIIVADIAANHALVRIGSIDDAEDIIAVGESINVESVEDDANIEATVYVMCKVLGP